MSQRITLSRRAPSAPAPTGQSRCGVAEIDITPHLGLPMAGYAVAGTHGKGVWGRLFARVLYLEDAAGERAALCFADRFRVRTAADLAFGWNLLGAVCGGLLEFFSMALGFRALTLVAVGAYLLAFLLATRADAEEGGEDVGATPAPAPATG